MREGVTEIYCSSQREAEQQGSMMWQELQT